MAVHFLFIGCDFLWAQPEVDSFVIPKLESDIILDGVINEDAWQGIEPLSMTSHWPEYGGSPGKKSEIRIAYTNKYLYWASVLYEEADRMQESSFKRDANWSLKFDQVAIVLDTYHDAENGVIFVVSPSGARTDQTVRNDAIDGRYFNNSWNTFWDAEVSIHKDRWEVEVRIPFSSLRFDTNDGITEMGLSVYRYSAHDKILDIFPEVSNEFGFFSFAKPSLTKKVQFSDLEYKRPAYFTPYVLGNSSRENELNSSESEYETIAMDEFSAGFDFQYALSNNVNMDLSFNTDFAQVEADNQQVNLTRFSLFFPEKRKFFQERSSTFEYNFDANNKLFYSRRIGLKSGNIIPLWGGIRMVGRAGKYDFGFLNMQSKTTDDYLSENYGVFRFRRDIINENSYLGGMLTSIFNKDGSYNIAYGLDALINVAGDEYLNINVAQSYGETGGEYDPADSWNRSRMHLMLQRRKNVGFGYQLSFNHVGDSYNPELGFENRKNYWRLGDEIFYNFWMPEESKLQKIDVSLQSRAFISYETNELESSQISPEISIVGKNEFLLNTSFDMIFDHPRDTFDLSDDIFIVPDKYYNNTINLSYSSPRINLFVLTMNYSQGGYYGGEIQSPGIGFNYLPSKYLQLDFFYEYNNIKIPGFPMYESHLGRFILTSSLNVKWTLSAFLQYNSNQNLWILNSRLRYNPKDGVNLYIVYNENFNSDIYRESPALPKSDSHSFVIKYSHTFEF